MTSSELEKDLVIIKEWGQPNWYYSPSSKYIYQDEGLKRVLKDRKDVPKTVIETIKKHFEV